MRVLKHRRWFDGDEDPVAAGSPIGRYDSASERSRIIEHHPDAICIHQDGVLVFGNPAAARLFGTRSVGELVGMDLARFVPNRSLVSMLARLAPLRRPGDVTSPVSAILHRLDGSAFHAEAVSVMTVWQDRVAYQLTLRGLGDHHRPSDAVALQAMLVEHANDAVIAVTGSGMVTSWNPAAERLYRRSPERALAQPVERAIGVPVALGDIVRDGGVLHTTHFALDGTSINVRMSVSAFDDGFVVQCCEVSESERADRDLRTVMEALQEGVMIVGQNRRLLGINPAARAILGLPGPDDELDDAAFLSELAVYDAEGTPLGRDRGPVETTFRTGNPIVGRLVGVDRTDGSRLWLMASFQLLYPDEPGTSPQLITFVDFTSQQATTERLEYQAAHDILTGLPNRAHLTEAVGTLLRGSETLFALLFIDLDDLKSVNDTLGHHIGDAVIQASAQRLREVVRGQDVVGRFSGDEFVALIVGNVDEQTIESMVTRIRHTLTRPLEIAGMTLTIGASIGVQHVEPDDTRDPAALLQDVDTAMYADKRRNRRAVTITGSGIDPGLGEDAPIR